jgi:hypothetical protein
MGRERGAGRGRGGGGPSKTPFFADNSVMLADASRG